MFIKKKKGKEIIWKVRIKEKVELEEGRERERKKELYLKVGLYQ